ncbi:huntingtin-interacting protein 1 isoform X1 [Hydra vulgaris]|uniref:huntingtin-interacting protein 1 isoform X1 n=1 Tax=Hydra vulgaris TaxID=6087 RepID=UPI001F5EDFA5|nr:huntingtin-interacting protein 1-like [Hydra vulgaris]
MTTLNEYSLQTRLDRRKGTMSEVDRAQYEKEQTECITKAIKNEESAAKEKHVRRAIIGTWQERGNSMFWLILGKQPLPSQPILCWKSMLVLHKILREGHPNVLRDSYQYKKTLRDLLSVYKFQGGAYGTLVCEYLKILLTKLDIHHKYPGIPGALTSSSETTMKIPDSDVNDVFTFAVECLDYQDLLLTFEENILKTLDKSRNNSQTASSQCKIAILVPILKECSGIYDILVLVVGKLHKSVPHDTLEGHRGRFNVQHKRMKTFCTCAGGMTYITNLIEIPVIPENPPNFLNNKYQPKQELKTVKEEPKPAPLLPHVDERDLLIDQLMKEIDELRKQLELAETQFNDMENNLRMQIHKLQEELRKIQMLAKQITEENSFLKDQLDNNNKGDSELQEKAKSADEKFNKLKDLYGKLRNDHIDLLRKNAEFKNKVEAHEKSKKELDESINLLKTQLSTKDNEIQRLSSNLDDLEKMNQKLMIDFGNSDEAYKNQLNNQLDQIAELKKALTISESLAENLQKDLLNIHSESKKQVVLLVNQISDISSAKSNEEAARKILEMQSQTLIKELTDKNKVCNEALDHLENEKLNLNNEKEKLESSIKSLKEKYALENDTLNKQLQMLQQNLQNLITEKQQLEANLLQNKAFYDQNEIDREKKHEDDLFKSKLELLASTAKECEEIIQETLNIFNDLRHENGTTCSSEYLKLRLEGLNEKILNTNESYSSFYDNHQDVIPLVNHINSTCHRISDAMINGKATSHMGEAEDSQNIVAACKNIGYKTLNYLTSFKLNQVPDLVKIEGSHVQQAILSLQKITEDIILKQQSEISNKNENIVDEEIQATEQIVADAALRIEEMLNKSRKTHTGIQLEVNERILDSCTGLMRAIRELILKSKDLQEEIVMQGRGSASVKEFYKRHHKWAEGLLSAAKSVGYGATILVDAADKVIEGKGKFEELIVASHEIAASTAQLVAASRVKASKNSQKLPPLMTASKNVGEATAGVVAAVKSGASMTEELKAVPDYSKMTLTQAKRYEMNSQVRIHELENELQKERENLGQLRKAHYQIAVELYGEEQVNLS